MGIYGQYHECYCFVTLTFNLKVTGGLLKVSFWKCFHFLAQFSYTESRIILWLVYIIHIYVLCKLQKFDLEALHWRSSTDRQSTWPRVIFGLFGDIFTLNADYIAWKLLKMALEVEYMMEYQHPGLPVTDLHLRSSTDRQSTWPRVIFGPLFVCLFVNKITQKLTDGFW